MKVIHHLTTWRLLAAMVAAVVLGEFLGYSVCQRLDIRFPAVGIGAVCVGLVVGMISWLYDGRDD